MDSRSPSPVFPAKAGNRAGVGCAGMTYETTEGYSVTVMDSRLRGNDGVGQGNDELGFGNDEIGWWNDELGWENGWLGSASSFEIVTK